VGHVAWCQALDLSNGPKFSKDKDDVPAQTSHKPDPSWHSFIQLKKKRTQNNIREKMKITKFSDSNTCFMGQNMFLNDSNTCFSSIP
jgi:hypothetical protein